MKKRFLRFLLVFVLLATVIPISASACGGFVAIKGEKVFHSIYCEEMTFENLDNMRWFDTAQKAKNSGLTMCESCSDYSDWDFDSEYCDSYWVTDDHLLLTAMELSMEYGVYSSEEYWYEKFYDQYGYLEDSDGYSWGYQEGIDKGYDNGYEAARAEFENATYTDGFDDGYERAEAECKERISELESVHREELSAAESQIPWVTILVVAVIAFVIGDTAGHRNYGDKLLKLESESRTNKFIIERIKKDNEKLTEQLQHQTNATYVLQMIAEKSGTSIDYLAESLFINFRKAGGCTEEAARAELQKEKQNWPQS